MAPLVSIVIPTGPAHAEHVTTALASCLWQTFTGWEAVIANDTGGPLHLDNDPRIRVVDVPAKEGRRSSIARNAGFQAARGAFIVPLDSDDYLLPGALERLIRGHATHDACYTYGWHYGLNRAGAWGLFRSPEYDREKLKTFNLHPITALIPTVAVQAVGGCDEGTPGLEDWTLWMRLAQAGCCGKQIYGPTFVYRRDEGVNHIADVDGGLELMDAVRDRFRNESGEITFMGCGCGGKAAEAKALARQVAGTLGREVMAKSGVTILEYTGPGKGAQYFGGPGRTPSGQRYRAGGGPAVRYIEVREEQDLPYLKELGIFQEVPPPAAFVPPPPVAGAPAEVAPQPTVPPEDGALHETLFEVPEDGKASKYPGRGKRKA